MAAATLLAVASLGEPTGAGAGAARRVPVVEAAAASAPTSPARCQPGRSCSRPACDFDGDGYGDLAVGVPGEDLGRGAVNIQYSRPAFLATPALLQGHFFNDDSVLEGSKFGAALACGDFNGDGVGDLAVGGPETRFGGDVWIFLGKAGDGLAATRYYVFNQNGANVPGSFQRGERFGYALVAGDFNGDGVDDLAIGDPLEPNPAANHTTGTVLVVPGKVGTLDFAGVQQLWGWTIDRSDEIHGQRFGTSLAAGQVVQGDGDDLAVGAPATTVKGRDGAGRVYLFRSKPALAGYQAVDEERLRTSGAPVGPIVKPQAGAYLGFALATGDFNGDGLTDLATGLPGKVGARGEQGGVVVVLPGTGDGLKLANLHYLEQDALGGVPEKRDRYGWSLAAGDWNEDQFDDLAVGAPYKSVRAGNGSLIGANAGVVYVHHGGEALLNGTGTVLRQGGGTVPGTPQYEDGFGLSLATVRLGSANPQFLVIGIPEEPFPAVLPSCKSAGAVQLLRSWPGLGPVTDASFLLHQDTAAPYAVADQRECSSAPPPGPAGLSEPPNLGEYFGWAIGR